MDDRIRISSTWLVIIAVGLVLFSYGAHSHKLFLEGLGGSPPLVLSFVDSRV